MTTSRLPHHRLPQYASDEALRAIAERARLVLIASRGAPVDPRLAPYFARTEPVGAALNLNVRPVLHEDAVLEIVRDELARAGSPAALRVFCQEESLICCSPRGCARVRHSGRRAGVVERFRDKLKMKAAVAAAGLARAGPERLDAGPAPGRPNAIATSPS